MILLGSLATAQEPPAAAAVDEVFGWIAAMGCPDAGGRPFVEVRTGGWSQHGREEPVAVTSRGLLVADDGKVFAVFEPDFVTRRYQRRREGGGQAERPVDYAPIELAAVADEQLGRDRSWSGAVDLYLGWVCASQGDPARAGRLLGRVTAAAQLASRGFDFREASRFELAAACLDATIQAFGDPEVPFAELQRRLERWLEVFSDHAGIDADRDLVARELLADLRRLAVASPLAGDDPAARLVDQLVHDAGGIMTLDGEPVLLTDEPSLAATRLCALGTAAVPALLAAFDDPRPTRAVLFPDRRRVRFDVVRVGTIAHLILDQIAATSTRHLERPAARRELEAWWRGVRERGEVAALVERAGAGDLGALERLARIAPAEVVALAPQAMATLDEPWERIRLAELLAGQAAPAAGEALRRMLDDVDPRVVVAAAAALLSHAPDAAAVAKLIAVFRAAAAPGAAFGQAGRALARCGSAAAMQALAMRRQVLDEDIVRALGRRVDGQAADADGEAAREQLLLGLLTEVREFDGNYGGVLNPRLCDFAAAALAERHPDRHAFDFEALRPDRDLQLWAILKAAGLDGPRATPPRQDAAPPPPPGLAERLATLAIEPFAAARQRLLAEVVELGALPALRRLRTSAVGDRRLELDAACRRLGSIVASVDLDGLGPSPTGVRETLVGLSGAPLRPEVLAEVLAEFGSRAVPGTGVVEVEVSRPTAGHGLRVRVATAAAGSGGERARYRAVVASGRRGLQSMTGAGVHRLVGQVGHYDGFVQALREAIAADDGAALEARYRLELP